MNSGAEEAVNPYSHRPNQIGVGQGGIVITVPEGKVIVTLEFGQNGLGQFVAIDERLAVRASKAGECLFRIRAEMVLRRGRDTAM